MAEEPVFQWSIYPNPLLDLLNIDAGKSGVDGTDFSIRIFNSAGCLMMEQIFLSCAIRLDVESLSSGIYTVRISNEKSLADPVIRWFVKS